MLKLQTLWSRFSVSHTTISGLQSRDARIVPIEIPFFGIPVAGKLGPLGPLLYPTTAI